MVFDLHAGPLQKSRGPFLASKVILRTKKIILGRPLQQPLGLHRACKYQPGQNGLGKQA